MRINRTALASQNKTCNKVSETGPNSAAELPWPIEMLPPHSLRPAARNARMHSKKQVCEIADSIERFGVINPIIADDRRQIVAGHARAAAAKRPNPWNRHQTPAHLIVTGDGQ
jgi:hypothetical protein